MGKIREILEKWWNINTYSGFETKKEAEFHKMKYFGDVQERFMMKRLESLKNIRLCFILQRR